MSSQLSVSLLVIAAVAISGWFVAHRFAFARYREQRLRKAARNYEAFLRAHPEEQMAMEEWESANL
jgi:CBS domain containing-hemolysin-like protein